MFNIWQWLQERQAKQVVELIHRADSDPELTVLWGTDCIKLCEDRKVGAAPPGLQFFRTVREIHYISKNVVTLAAGIMRREDFKREQSNDPANQATTVDTSIDLDLSITEYTVAPRWVALLGEMELTCVGHDVYSHRVYPEVPLPEQMFPYRRGKS